MSPFRPGMEGGMRPSEEFGPTQEIKGEIREEVEGMIEAVEEIYQEEEKNVEEKIESIATTSENLSGIQWGLIGSALTPGMFALARAAGIEIQDELMQFSYFNSVVSIAGFSATAYIRARLENKISELRNRF